MVIEFDLDNDRSYLRTSTAKVGLTRKVDDNLSIDFDHDGNVVGVKVDKLSQVPATRIVEAATP